MGKKKKGDGSAADGPDAPKAGSAPPAVAAPVKAASAPPSSNSAPKAAQAAAPKAAAAGAKAEPKAPAAKAESKAKAKAAAEGAAPPKAKADAKPKAKAAATAGAKAAAPAAAKAEGKAKAEAKSEVTPQGKAKAKAEPAPAAKAAEAAPVAKPKAKASTAKAAGYPAKAAAPPAARGSAAVAAPAVVAPASAVLAEEAGDDFVRKKRRPRKKAAEEPPEVEEPEPAAPSLEVEAQERDRIRSERDAYHNEVYEKLRKDFEVLPDIAASNVEEVTREVLETTKTALERMVAEVDGKVKSAKIPKPASSNTGKIMAQIAELRRMRNEGKDDYQQMLDLEAEKLRKSIEWESFRMFRDRCEQLKELCEGRLGKIKSVESTVRSQAQQRRTLMRVANSKGVKAEELGANGVVSLTPDLPPEVTLMQFLHRKLTAKYGVVIDRPDGGKGGAKGSGVPKGLVVRGVEAEAIACVAELKSAVQKVLQLNAKQAYAVFGPNIRKIEDNFKGVYIEQVRERSQVNIYGPGKEVAACLSHIQGLVPEEEPTVKTDPDRAKALVGKKGESIKKIETESGTSIKVDKDEGVVRIVTGDKASQEKARELINAFLKRLSVVNVPADAEAIKRLWEVMKDRGGKPGSRPSKFAELRDNSGLTVVRKSDGVVIVGDKATVDKYKVVLEECVSDASRVPMLEMLTPDQAKIWGEERVEALRAGSGCKVTKNTRAWPPVLEITGTDAEQAKAKAHIQEIHDRFGCVEKIEGVSDAAVRSLTTKRAERLREVERREDVSIGVDRETQVITIMGSKEQCVKAKKALESFINSAASTTTREIQIGKDEGRVVIGRQGSTVRNIKSSTGLDDLQVEDGGAGEKKKVILRGSAEAVEAAVQMVHEALARAKEQGASAAPAPSNGGPSAAAAAAAAGGAAAPSPEAPAKASPSEAAAAARGPSPDSTEAPAASDEGANVEEEARPAAVWKGKAKAVPRQPDVNLESTELFPSLGCESGGAKGRRQPRNSAWGRSEENGGAKELDDAVEEVQEAPASHEVKDWAAEEEDGEENADA